MSKINVLIPEPNKDYLVENQRQTNLVLNTLINQLNTTFQKDIKDQGDIFNWFLS
jgi:hypothetical protein